MKKLLALLLAVVMLLSFAACSKDDDDDDDEKGSSGSSKGISLEDAVGYLEEMFNADVDNYEKLIPQEIWDMREEQVENYDELLEESKEATKQNYESMLEEFGDDAKVTVSYEKGDDLDEDDVKAIGDALERDFEMDPDSVKAACDVTLKYKVTGSEGEEEETEEYVAVQIGNSWYLVNYYEIGDELSVSFLL